MPVLEAMACGLPVIATGGGPTDEFCPPEAGWRIRSTRAHFPEDRVDSLATVGRPWVLEPDAEHLVELLREAAAISHSELRARGDYGRRAAKSLSWDDIAERYRSRITVLANRRPRFSAASSDPFPFEEEVELRVLATPAWGGADELAGLLRDWSDATTRSTSACLYLLADPAAAGSAEAIEGHVLQAAAAAEVDLDGCADINILLEPMRADRDQRLHASVDAYVPLHPATGGHRRLAEAAGSARVGIGTGELSALIADRLSPRVELPIGG
jgi:hypothetical protein